MLRLTGKKTLVTGGTSGIGREIAASFARQGAHVVIFGTNIERAQESLSYLESCRVNSEQIFLFRIVNIADKSAVEAAMQPLLVEFGSIDVLVNNAGIT